MFIILAFSRSVSYTIRHDRSIFRHDEVTAMENIPRGIPMSQLELFLKQLLERRPEIGQHILSPKELADYILWMSETYGGTALNARLAGDVRDFEVNTEFAESTKTEIEQARPEQIATHLTDIYENQEENAYMTEAQDISVSRMLRYMPAHWHTNEYFEIYYLVEGSCPIWLPDEVIQMKPGTVLVIAPQVLHASPCYSDDAVLMAYLVRSSTFDQVFWRQLPEGNLMTAFFRQALDGTHKTAYLHFETGEDEDILRVLHQIHRESRSTDAYRAQMLNALMSAFFILLLRRYEETARLPRTKEFRWKHQFSAIFSYIQTHYATSSLTETAQHFHYSERQVSRIVLEYTGQNYAQLVLRLKMERAAALLKQKKTNAEHIASALGYANTSSFFRAFSKYYGFPPSKFSSENSGERQ